MIPKIIQEKFIACLVGGAIGDALGAPVEFMKIGQIRDRFGLAGVTDYVEFEDGTGEFTDDTQMTLFTAEGLLRVKYSHDLNGNGETINLIVHKSYLRWLHTQEMPSKYGGSFKSLDTDDNGWLMKQTPLFQRRAPGNTCLSALRSGIAGCIEKPINNSKGCGGIMRVAPAGLVFYGQNERAFQTACELAALTHGHPSGYLSAGFLASLISDLSIAIPLETAISNAIAILMKWEGMGETLFAVRHVIMLFDESKTTLKSEPQKIPQIIEKLGSGWVGEEALSISLFCCLIYPDDFEKGLLAAINHSGDSDSTGLITGNVLGLMNCLSAIPEKWITKLRYHQIVEEIGKDLHTAATGSFDDLNKEWWDKYPTV